MANCFEIKPGAKNKRAVSGYALHAQDNDLPLSNALKILRSQKCKIPNDKSIPSEPNKKQRLILAAINDTVGKFSRT